MIRELPVLAGEDYMTRNGPGKFHLAVDEVAHTATLEGWESEHEGLDDYNGNIWLIYEADFTDRSLRYGGQTPLNLADALFLSKQTACVAVEYPSGFFEVDWFEDSDAAKAEYDRRVSYFAPPDDWDW